LLIFLPLLRGGIRWGGVASGMKNILYNHKEYKTTRQNLRKQEVGAEKLLWSKLRNKQQLFKFRRQHGIGKFVVDFYCPELKLAIEVDGETHSTDKEIKNDLAREEFIKRFGIEIKRYRNYDIYNNIEGILVDVNEVCFKRKDKLKKLVRA
jgi:very-short-patch-repair endonuclease